MNKSFSGIRILAVAALVTCTQASFGNVILPAGSSWEYSLDGGPWTTGLAPFGNQDASGPYDHNFDYNTFWPAFGKLQVKTEVDFTGYDLSTIQYDLGVDNGFDLFANGNFVAGGNAEGFTSRWEYSGAIPQSFLNSGKNIIEVTLEDHGVATAFDMQITGTPTNTPDAGSTLALLGGAFTLLGSLRRKFSI